MTTSKNHLQALFVPDPLPNSEERNIGSLYASCKRVVQEWLQ